MFRLRRYFLIVGGGAFLCFTLLFTYASYLHDRNNLKHFGERENITLAGYLSTLLIDTLKTYTARNLPSERAQLLEQPEIKLIDRFLSDFSEKYPILKVKVFDLQGQTIYSTVKKEVGVQKGMNTGLKSAAIDSRPHSEMAFKDEITSLSGSLFKRAIVETYIPVLSEDNKVIAVFELYSDVTELVTKSNQALLIFLILQSVGYIILFILLYIVVKRADSMIKSQYYQLNESHALLKDAKVNLEKTVQERTNELSETVKRLESEIVERKNKEEKIHHLAHHDTLTGLFNRFSLEIKLEQAIAQNTRSNKQLAILFIDLDRFKIINDTLGHKAGDHLLVKVSEKLKALCQRQTDIVARIGGDEFVIVLSELTSPTFAALTGTALVQVLSLPVEYGKHELLTSPSIGIAIYPDDGESIDTLLKNADTAMYHVKESGRANFQFYTRSMNKLIEEKMLLEKELRTAIKENSFELYYQPQICTIEKRICGVEALIRWNHPTMGFISPERFISIAEESKLILDIGTWVIDQAFRQIISWNTQGYKDIRMAINVSAKQLESSSFVSNIEHKLKQYQVKPDLIELEVTESSAMVNPEEAISKLQEIRDLGIELAIDDFGTGHSSLSYIQKLPINNLKLDRSFVMDVEHNKNNASICLATISLAHSLGFKVVAEGVENKLQSQYLQDINCDILQGFYFSKPKPAQELEKLLNEDISNLLETDT
ncbi:MAG: EAL domain-containing protein [Gammaproteobacteria bacterium]|nr:EAL domain-containing protein [Gammaproteobacteria bacterium]